MINIIILLCLAPISINLIWVTFHLRLTYFCGILSKFCSGRFSWNKIQSKLAGANFFPRFFVPKIYASIFLTMWPLYGEKSTFNMVTILNCMVTILNCMITILICMITILNCMVTILICMVTILICMVIILICMVSRTPLALCANCSRKWFYF